MVLIDSFSGVQDDSIGEIPIDFVCAERIDIFHSVSLNTVRQLMVVLWTTNWYQWRVGGVVGSFNLSRGTYCTDGGHYKPVRTEDNKPSWWEHTFPYILYHIKL